MTVQLREVAPADIEKESFTIIAQEIGEHGLAPETFAVVQRVIHATGDFSYLETMRFSPNAIGTGIAALKAGKNIVTDVNMVATGISRSYLKTWGGQVLCRIGEEETRKIAEENKKTRAEVALARSLDSDTGIFVCGNAPTALVQAIRMLKDLDPAQRPLVVGMPVGFVNAVESKDLLVQDYQPHITNLGRKGGTPAAVAVVNALLRLAAAA